MIAPPVMTIYSAVESLKTLTNWLKQSQLKELRAFGDDRAQALGATGLSKDFVIGYELGLQTARTVLLTSATLAIQGVDPKEVL